jgi:hypothetical protein
LRQRGGAELQLSRFRHARDNEPKLWLLSWDELAETLITDPPVRDDLGASHEAKERLPAWSATRFQPGATRSSKAAIELALLVLDIDDGSAPQKVLSAFARWERFLYTSWSHMRPDKEGKVGARCRLAIRLKEPVPVGDWERVWRWAVQHTRQLGVVVDEKALKDVARIYFLPALRDEAHRQDWLGVRETGEPLDWRTICPELVPLPAVKPSRLASPGEDRESQWRRKLHSSADNIASMRDGRYNALRDSACYYARFLHLLPSSCEDELRQVLLDAGARSGTKNDVPHAVNDGIRYGKAHEDPDWNKLDRADWKDEETFRAERIANLTPPPDQEGDPGVAQDPSHRPHPDAFGDSWRTLGEWQGSEDWLDSRPPPRRWLLRQPPKVAGMVGEGVFPMGKVGLLVAAGSAGKTMALAQLAVAVALPDEAHERYAERFSWFGGMARSTPIRGGLQVAQRGRVLLVLGEEDIEEVRRRLFTAWRLYGGVGASGEEAMRWRASLRQRLVLVPGAGNSQLGLTTQTVSGEALSDTARQLQARLEQTDEDWALVIADPLSRFAGADAEKDNRAATLLVQAFETLLRAPGNPAVLVAHHTSQAARASAGGMDATNARGVTGLSDGIRWQCELRPRPRLPNAPSLVTWGVTKTNYALEPPGLVLQRGEEGGLHVASSEALEQYRMAELQAAEDSGEHKAARREAENRGKQKVKGTNGQAKPLDPMEGME